MKMVVQYSLAFLALSSPLLQAQKDDFPNLKWREKETDHFMIRSNDTNSDPARRYADKVFEEMVSILPGLTPDFEKNEFKTPSGRPGSEGEKFRFTVYLLGSGDGFHECVTTDSQRNNWAAGNVQITKQVGNYRNHENRYVVICKTDALSSGGNETDKKEVLVHHLGAGLMKIRSQQSQLPFWMTAGMGYYAEHQIFKRCAIYYLDFEAYYQNNPDAKVDAKEGGTLGPEKPWPRVIRKLCRSGKRVSLQRCMNAKVISLSPNESGYIFALTSYLVSDEAMKKKYASYIGQIRDGKEADEALLLKAYGYTDAASFEKDWYEWIESSKFK